jgi:hypothetical protein
MAVTTGREYGLFVNGQIVPWNYPLTITTWKLAPALAAGRAVVLEPDSATPLTALRLPEVGFPRGAVNIVPGAGRMTGAYLVRHPGVQKIAFTAQPRRVERSCVRRRRRSSASPSSSQKEPEPRGRLQAVRVRPRRHVQGLSLDMSEGQFLRHVRSCAR